MQGVICPSCGALAPPSSTECPECGVSLRAQHDRTHVKARYDDNAGRTIDDSSDEDLPFVSEKRTAPHEAIKLPSPSSPPPPGRRLASGAVQLPVSDATIPFKGGGQQNGSAATKDTGPSLGTPATGVATVSPAPPQPSPAGAPARRISTVRHLAPTERQPAIRVESVTPQVLEKPEAIPHDTQPAVGGKKDALVGTKLGEYVVEERVGIGGMGIVYRAVQPLIGNSVAIKVLRPDVIADENDLQRFLGEARTVNSIRHRSIISIFGASDTPDGRKYLVMEYLEGESLEARLQREGRLPAADALPILEDVLSALAAAHSANVVHRDLKPANVFLVNQSDGRPWVKLLDFGLARGANKQDVSRIAGTPDYISPEHARGRPAGPAADLYAFGVLAFHLLTGKLPFVGNTPMEVMEQHVHKAPPVPHEVDDSIPLAMSNLILRLLDKEPSNRPDAKTVKADLKAAAKELRQAQTQIGRPPVNPNVSGNTVLRGPPTPIADVKDLPLDPRLARRAMEADRARSGSWFSRNWPWVAGGFAVLWMMGVAIWLLTRPSTEPDLGTKPVPRREVLTPPEPPDMTGAVEPTGAAPAKAAAPAPVAAPAPAPEPAAAPAAEPAPAPAREATPAPAEPPPPAPVAAPEEPAKVDDPPPPPTATEEEKRFWNDRRAKKNLRGK